MPVRVRYVECDMQGRVFNGHYLTWVDMAHSEAMRDLFGSYRELTNRGIDLVVAAAQLQFRAPATFDDELMVHVDLDAPGNTSLRSHFSITRGGDPIADATMVHVCVDAISFDKQPWPEWFRHRLTTPP